MIHTGAGGVIDTLSKAEKERSLKSKSYDAYIDRATVNGRSYQGQDRTGCFKEKLRSFLTRYSQNRYSGSYMVKG